MLGNTLKLSSNLCSVLAKNKCGSYHQNDKKNVLGLYALNLSSTVRESVREAEE